MELWIRNQDKTALIKVDRIVLEIFDNMKPTIYFNDDFLGEYETKERALEVLDEIQKILEPQKIIKTIDNSVKFENAIHIVNPTYETITQLNTYVYEMPKD